MYKKYIKIIVFISILISATQITSAQTVDELKNKISDRNNTIQKLEDEINQYQKDIDALGKEKASLSNTLKSLDISKKKLEADTKVTENKIAARNLELKELSLQIGDKSERIIDSKRVISQSLYTIFQANSKSALETVLGTDSISDILDSTDRLTTLQGNMHDRIKALETLRVNLEDNKKATEKKKAELVVLTNDLKSQTSIIAETVKEKNDILKETKNTEANYNKLLATKQQQKDAFEKEVLAYESALKTAIDPNSIPSTGSGILKFPLAKIIITQYFGNTEFSTKNPQIYSGKGHPGVDFGTPIGTPVKAALGGIISGIGNTDAARNCRSFGKWIMVKHPNGLSTLYAHLSLINVSEGQEVGTGQVMAYSGNTGYSTGPHLHFGVYATEGVNMIKNKGSAWCSTVKIPYASFNAYLNPLSYL